jgi:hypothetical protein
LASQKGFVGKVKIVATLVAPCKLRGKIDADTAGCFKLYNVTGIVFSIRQYVVAILYGAFKGITLNGNHITRCPASALPKQQNGAKKG